MACTDCTVTSSLKRGDLGAVNIRLILNTTASALNGVPSWNFTSVRSVNTSLVLSAEAYDQEIARSGRMELCSSTLTNVSYIFSMTWRSTSAVDLRGSRVTMSESTPTLILPLYFDVVVEVLPPPHAAKTSAKMMRMTGKVTNA